MPVDGQVLDKGEPMNPQIRYRQVSLWMAGLTDRYECAIDYRPSEVEIPAN